MRLFNVRWILPMPRKPRVQFPGAIYHVVTRGDGRRELFHDQGHYQRFTDGLEAEVLRSAWQIIAYCWMPNHIHLLVKTPEPNLSNGMQHWLSGYANWYSKRNRRSGHLFQGRFKAFQVEDDSYFWTLSRYIHLNPCVGKKPLVQMPQDWKNGSYSNYIYKREAKDWIASELLLDSWRAEFGGSAAGPAYRRFVERQIGQPMVNPLKSAHEGWVLGSEKFLQKIVKLSGVSARNKSLARRVRSLTIEEIIESVATHHKTDRDNYIGFRSTAPGRELAALLCRELTNVSLADLSHLLGLGHPDSSANLVKKARRLIKEDAKQGKRYQKLKQKLLKTENQG